MNLYDFRLLGDKQQVDVLYMEGVYLGKRKLNNSSVLLYQIDGFYVEIFYRKHRRIIERIRAFSSTYLLHPYLQQMDIEVLVS